MPGDELDKDDPYELVGVAFTPNESDGMLEEMARCFIEEFFRMGWDEAAVLGLFQNPFYRGPHAVYRKKGEEHVRWMIGQVRKEWTAR